MGWRFPILGMAAATLLLILLYMSPGDPTLRIIFLAIPCVALLVLALLVLLIFRRTRRLSGELLLATLVFIAATSAGWRYEHTLRPAVRWAVLSHKLKREVLAQPDDAPGSLKHVEWDGWGGAPIGDWTSYVVFDPENSLKVVTNRPHPGFVRGIPCDVLSVQRLESRWYSVTLEMDEWWGRCRHERNLNKSE
jgi:hypothetical protein